jgi:Fur family ferric uptake transcriptional regulator
MIMIINNIMSDIKKIDREFKEFISSKGLRRTSQRDEILREITLCGGHITADELYERIKKKNPNIGFATISRNLKLLCEAGILEEIKIGVQKARFELTSRGHHDHLICVRCGRFIEIFSNKIESLQEELAKENGFKIIRHRLDIFGICKDCQRRTKG